jgi:hypothetical protein
MRDDRGRSKPATFAPRKPGAPAGKSGFNKPQRARSGGFGR